MYIRFAKLQATFIDYNSNHYHTALFIKPSNLKTYALNLEETQGGDYILNPSHNLLRSNK
jgi:hypothetical protein